MFSSSVRALAKEFFC